MYDLYETPLLVDVEEAAGCAVCITGGGPAEKVAEVA